MDFSANTGTKWDKGITKQPVLGADFKVIKPTKQDWMHSIEFDFPTQDVLIPGLGTRFHVEAIFEKRADGATEWKPLEATDADSVMLSANWFDKMITDVNVTSNVSSIKIHDEWIGFRGVLNTFLYAHMKPSQKKFLCFEEPHPGNAVGVSKSDWDFTGKVWKDYASHVFKEKSFKFSWIPLNVWPFHQDGLSCKSVPLYAFPRMKVILNMSEKQDSLFTKKDAETNKTSYRVRIIDIVLAAEVARLNPMSHGKPFKKGCLHYNGCVRKMDFDSMSASTHSHRKIMTGIKIPSGLLIFAVPIEATGGDASKMDFLKHNITNVRVCFNDEELYEHNPRGLEENFDVRAPKRAKLRLSLPIASVDMDPAKLNHKQIVSEDSNYSFPHIYVPLNHLKNQRILPNTGLTPSLQQPGKLSIFTSHDVSETTSDYLLVYYALYDDVTLSLNTTNEKIEFPYK